jgi:ribosomal protein S25
VSVEDDEHSGKPSTSKRWNILKKIRESIHKDHRWTMYELADTVGISYGVCQEILTENLNVSHLARKFVPWLFNKQSKAAASKCVSWAKREG